MDGVTQSDCDNLGSRYGGDESDCATLDPPCVPLPGACCDEATGSCVDGVTQSDCDDLGFRHGGIGSDCASIDPPPCLLECTLNAECDDSDPCSFDRCIDNQCSYEGARYGDVAGLQGVCGPNDDVALSDIMAIQNGFESRFAEGCELVNVDMAGANGSCVSNGIIDLFDILNVLDAFQGLDRCCAGQR